MPGKRRRRKQPHRACGRYDDRQRGGRSSPASQPTASVIIGSTATKLFSVLSQVEHSKVRSSNPRSPGEMRANAILCLHTGHMGRSWIELPITLTPRDHRQSQFAVPNLCTVGGGFQAFLNPWNGRGRGGLVWCVTRIRARVAPPEARERPRRVAALIRAARTVSTPSYGCGTFRGSGTIRSINFDARVGLPALMSYLSSRSNRRLLVKGSAFSARSRTLRLLLVKILVPHPERNQEKLPI
jgi:hypothetical protein